MISRISAGWVTAFLLLFVFTLAAVDGADQGQKDDGTYAAVSVPNYYAFFPTIKKVDQQPCTVAPTLLKPINGGQLDTLIPLFIWDNGNDPAVTILRLKVATDPAMQNHVWGLWHAGPPPGIDEIRFSINFDPARTYYWQAWFECGKFGHIYSDVWSFKTGSGGVILPGPRLIAPGDGSDLSILQRTFEWASVGGAAEYIYNWSELGDSGYFSANTPDTTFENHWLGAGKEYEWWVKARNEYAFGNDSAYWQFSSPVPVSAEQPSLSADGADVEIFRNGDQVMRIIVVD